ncbi:hypothetical protein EV192_11660 [Actinocrispum wychmicini]|uniref:Uncharacterized protein n=1 Tax=Actinocrispum wychmicini TaxID=1213861 RepID=A0A4R2ISN2_9PSEU|nr:hypothetical protein EV192_11660 [Actinocrispum wychmicini]
MEQCGWRAHRIRLNPLQLPTKRPIRSCESVRSSDSRDMGTKTLDGVRRQQWSSPGFTRRAEPFGLRRWDTCSDVPRFIVDAGLVGFPRYRRGSPFFARLRFTGIEAMTTRPGSAHVPTPLPRLITQLRGHFGPVAGQAGRDVRERGGDRAEISRWERGKRIPGPYWRRWLSVVWTCHRNGSTGPPDSLDGHTAPLREIGPYDAADRVGITVHGNPGGNGSLSRWSVHWTERTFWHVPNSDRNRDDRGPDQRHDVRAGHGLHGAEQRALPGDSGVAQ